MSLHPIAGMKIYIGIAMDDQADDFIESDFTSISPDPWTLIDGLETLGQIGDGAADISTTLINRDRTVSQKGAADAGVMSNVFAYIPDDDGQIALIAAGQPSDKNNYGFKVVGNETSDVSGFEPSVMYFIGTVMGTQEPGGGANTIRKLTANIKINSNVVHVAAG